MSRVLRRKVIIREYDFFKVEKQAIGNIGFVKMATLYDRASFTPLNEDSLEKLKLAEILKGKENDLTNLRVDLTHPASVLYYLRDYLYNSKYYDWNLSMDETGCICVQSRSNTPKSRLGWAIFEKDMF